MWWGPVQLEVLLVQAFELGQFLADQARTFPGVTLNPLHPGPQ